VTTGPGTGRVSTSEAARHAFALAEAAIARRDPAPPEHSIELSTTTIRPAGEKAYRVHNWSITIRGTDAGECYRMARNLDDGYAARYASELDTDTLGAQLAASVVAKDNAK